MNDKRNWTDFAGLEPPLEAAVKAVLAEALSEEAIEQVNTRAQHLAVGKQQGRVHPAPRSLSPGTWSWILRHPASAVMASVIFVLAIAGSIVWFHGSGATPAFAEFLQPILEAKTAKYKMTVEMPATPARMAEMAGLSAEKQKELMKPLVTEVLEFGFNRVRRVSKLSDKSDWVDIWDGQQRKQLILEPAKKRATLYEYAQSPDDKTSHDKDPGVASAQRPGEPGPVAMFRALLLDTLKKPGCKREPLGEKVIDGRRVVGFRFSVQGTKQDVWGDPDTRLPVLIETTIPLMPNCKVTASDFEFNVPLDESLFSVEPPAGYEVTVRRSQPSDDSPAGEQDLVEMFRYYGQWSGERFPDVLDMQWIDGFVSKMEWLDANLDHDKPKEKRDQQLHEARQKIQRGMLFTVLLSKKSDWHYAGRGVSLGASDTPVFWYRPQDAELYRVINADLSIRGADTPPDMPIVPVVQLEQDVVEMLRQYSELNGGLFPDKLDDVSLYLPLMHKAHAYHSQDPPQKLSAKEMREMTEALVRLRRGYIFASLLPPEADWHYAGKGVWLGEAERPVFWYRPNQSKAYRVIYADLSVRVTDRPPSMPVVPLEQDLLNALRYYSELFDGRFPVSLNDPVLLGQPSLLVITSIKIDAKFPAGENQNPSRPSPKRLQEMSKASKNIQPGLDFIESLPSQSDWHYAGWGVSHGDAERPIFWYHPQDSTKYRVIYADLSVRDADSVPDVPGGPPLQDLIDALRYYSEKSGGTFPDSLDRKELFRSHGKKSEHYTGQPTPQQVKEFSELELNLGPGAAFVAALPPEAKAHYAGQGVSLGAADTPIFWYRPKNFKDYRVVFADLAVHETDTPPNVANAQPVSESSNPQK